MVANKHISKIIIVVMAAAVILCFLAMAYSDELTEMLGGTGVRMEYESKLFNTDELIKIDIQMGEDEWNKMLSNAISEEYYVCDVVINGEKLKSVAIRPKGNTSLSSIARDPDNNRYSFKLEFDQFYVFRDRQISNALLKEHGDIRVIKSRNISDDFTKIKSRC